MKKIIPLIVSLCTALVISAAVPVSAAESVDTGYDDVASSDWFNEAVQYVTDKKLFGGTGDREFSPDTAMTRGMFVTVLGRTAENMKLTVPDNVSGFSDVDDNAYYSKYIAWAANSGIVNGLGNNIFAPDNEVTREQMCKIFVEFFGKFISDNLPVSDSKIDFADSGDISDWAAGYVEKAQMAGLIVGLEIDGQMVFRPQSFVTRAAAATLFMRADKLKDSILSSEGSDNTSGGGSSSGGSTSGSNTSGSNTSGGGSSGGGGGSSGGGGGSSSGGNTEADKTKTAVEYINKIVKGYEEDSSLIATRSEATQDCLSTLITTAKDALDHYDATGELNKEYVNSHYSSQISDFKKAYNDLSDSDRNELQSTVLNWASYSQINYVYEFLK